MSAGGWIADLLGYKDILSGAGLMPRRKALRFLDGLLSDNPSLGTTDITLAGTAHGALQIADGIHGGVAFSFPSAGARTTAPMGSTDLYKFAVQTDTPTPTLWILLGLSSGVGVWGQVNLTGGLSPVGTILGSEPAWHFDGTASTIVDAGGGAASSATDTSGHGVNLTWASGARPTIHLTGLNEKPTLAHSTSQFGGNASYVMPAPGTTLTYGFAIARCVSTVTGPILFISHGPAVGQNIYIDSGSKLQANFGSVGAQSSILSINTWYRIEYLLSNQDTDYLQINSIAGTAANAGNTGSTGFTINAESNGVSPATWEIAEWFEWTGASAPTGGMRTSLASYSSSKWGV